MPEMNFKALIDDSAFSSGGLLTPKQGSVFIDRAVDETVTLKEAQIKKMTTNEEELDILDLASRVLRKHTKGQKGTSTDITTTKRTISLTEAKMWFEVDIRTLKRLTIEADGKDVNGKLMAHIMKIAQTVAGNDLEDLGWNGDTASGDPFVSIADGWLKKAKADGIAFDTNASTDYKGVVFPGMVDALPNKYQKNPADLRLYVSPAVRRSYIRQISAGSSSAALAYLTGELPATFEGIPVVAVPKLPDTDMVLTLPQNLVMGVDISGIERDLDKRVVERVIDAVLYVPVGYEIVLDDAIVVGYDVLP